MMIGNSTSCRNVCAIHATMMMVLCDLVALGSDTSVSTVKMYATTSCRRSA